MINILAINIDDKNEAKGHYKAEKFRVNKD